MSREPLYEQVSEGQAERGRKGKSWPCVQRKSLWSDWHLIEIKLLRYLEVGWIRIPACCSVCPPSPLFCYLSFFPLFYSLLFNSGYSPFAPVRTRVFLSLSLSFSPPSLALLLSLSLNSLQPFISSLKWYLPQQQCVAQWNQWKPLHIYSALPPINPRLPFMQIWPDLLSLWLIFVLAILPSHLWCSVLAQGHVRGKLITTNKN